MPSCIWISAHTVTLDQAGMQLDLGAIGKGYAADEALAVLARLGIGRALVAMSGDLAFGDPPPGRPGWKLGIDGPGEGADGFTRRLDLCNAAVSTSGAREQNLEAGGVKYSHIVNPATGVGLTDATMVTVVARHGIDADAWSTALSVVGAERGMRLVEGHEGWPLGYSPRVRGRRNRVAGRRLAAGRDSGAKRTIE